MDTENIRNKLHKLPFGKLMECVQKYIVSENHTVKNLRKFHNWIKSSMLTNLTKLLKPKFKTVNLLDIAVGRGGDLYKWDIAGINNVFGFDKSVESVNEARARYDEYRKVREDREDRKDKKKEKLNVVLTTGDATFPLGSGPEIEKNNPLFVENIFQKIQDYMVKTKIDRFQIVSCQFAIHYFFKDENSIRNVLNLVSALLVEGGYFIGTTFNSTLLIDLIKKYNTKEIKQDLFTLVKRFDKIDKSGYGNGYTFYFNEEDTGIYFNELENKELVEEYLVDFKLLEKLAKEYNLKTNKINLFDIKSNAFKDIYPLWISKTKNLTIEEQEVSFLNNVFVFEKF